jgi:ribosome assembly protein 1
LSVPLDQCAAIFLFPFLSHVLPPHPILQAIDGWGFSLDQFAVILAAKFKCRAAPLLNTLWGDYYVTKEKGKVKVKRGALAKGKPPLFVSTVLQTIWDVYDGILVKKDNVQAQKDKMAKICATLKIKVRCAPPLSYQPPLATSRRY